MINRDRRCVHVAKDNYEAGVVFGWLELNGIPAEIMDSGTNGGFEGVTWLVPAISYKGIEVWVVYEDDIDRAIALMAEKTAEIHAFHRNRANRQGEIEALCEECGNISVFEMAYAGKTENCLFCNAYIDVPNPDEEPDDEYWKDDAEESM